MKINRVVFKNFSAIYNALRANTLRIDFTKAENKICIIIGPNGGGKTTILSMLHPFADLGNLDVRNGNMYILEEKEGYKEIEIQKDKDVYLIKHIYSPHKDKSHSVKSYIQKNGTELNTNGNVSSFKEFVKEELHIEPEYLKLIRLGSNVTNLINLSATERKNFMSKMLEDIGIYLEYYKSINAKIRQLSDIISHDEDRMNRLNIVDESLYKEDLLRLQEQQQKESDAYTKNQSQVAIYERELSKIADLDQLTENLHKAKRKLDRMENVKSRKMDIKNIDFYTTEIASLEKENLVLQTELDGLHGRVDQCLETLDTLNTNKRSFEVRMEKESNVDKEIARMSDNLTIIRKRMQMYEESVGDFTSEMTNDDVDTFTAMMDHFDQLLNTSFSVGKEPVEKVASMMENKQNVQTYVDKHLLALDEDNHHKDSLLLMELTRLFFSPEKQVTFVCDKECDAKKLYDRIKNIVEHPEDVINKKDAAFYQDMNLVYQNFHVMFDKIHANKEVLKKLPEEMQEWFKMGNIFDSLKECKPFYNKKEINTFLSNITELFNYNDTKETYENEEEVFRKFSSLSHGNEVSEDLRRVTDEMDAVRDEIQKTREEMLIKKEQLDANDKTLVVDREIKEMLEDFDSTKELYDTYESEYQSYKINMENVRLYKEQADNNRIHMEVLNKEIQDMNTALTLYKDLKKQLKKLHKIYDEMHLLKEALSPKEGIPLHFIRNYLGNVEEVTNELLNIAYDGKLYIDDFVITATEFSIPFYHNGIRLGDVKYASQGELSFLSLALSFALSAQSISKYNIMLADEIDGALDTKNRAKFVEIVENQIDRIQAEQSFLITHNNMFSSYPVDIIDLSFTNDTDSYPLANFITIERK